MSNASSTDYTQSDAALVAASTVTPVPEPVAETVFELGNDEPLVDQNPDYTAWVAKIHADAAADKTVPQPV